MSEDGPSHRRHALHDAPYQLLAERAGEGDVRAFTVLVRRCEPVMRVIARRILGSTSDVDDVVQDALITAWNELPRLRNPEAVRGWLVTIARRKAFDRVRARPTMDDIDIHPELAGHARTRPDVIVETRQSAMALTTAANRLPADQRRAWFLREVVGCSYAEVAREIGVPESTVRGLLARARASLLQDMEVWRWMTALLGA